MFKSGSADLKAGESSERGGNNTAKSGKAAGDLKVVTLEASVESSEEHGAKTTRNEDGTLDAEWPARPPTRFPASSASSPASSAARPARRIRSRPRAATSSRSIRRRIRTASGRRRSTPAHGQADYDKFAAKYPETVESATRGTDETDSNTVGLSVGGVDAEIGLSNRVKKTTKTGKGGKLEETKVVGSAGAGGSIGVGDTRIGDSVENVADATIDGQATPTSS